MRCILILLFLYSLVFSASAQKHSIPNLALHLDGMDNNVRIGMDIIRPPWTLEAWIKGESSWKKQEVIIGGGEYSNLNICDNLPLEVKDGRLHNERANLWSSDILDNNWHYVALSCDGTTTYLHLDNEIIDSSHTAYPILPGTLGVDRGDSTTFRGLIDEVRIWRSYIAPETIRHWKNRPVSPSHPGFSSLIGYYNFDDGIGDVSTNWVGEGDRAYHLRNGRSNYKGKAPLAYTVISDNSNFIDPDDHQRLFNAVVINNEWDTDIGTKDAQILKLRIAVRGSKHPMTLSRLQLDLGGLTRLSDLDKIHVYYTGNTAHSDKRIELFGRGQKPAREMLFTGEKEPLYLTPGINYFLVTADISDHALVGDSIRMTVPSFKLNERTYVPKSSTGQIFQQIIGNSKTTPNTIRVLQWNIWHGGRHLGTDGVSRVIELIKSSHADIITMQEGYGSQERIRDSLHYFMETASPNDNLALLSRYPITGIQTKYNSSRSNPAMVTLPSGQRILINSCWLRYAPKSDAPSHYQNTGLFPENWILGDSLTGLVDIKNIIDKDTNPYIDGNEDLPIIIAGDFNSCSHLDWTKAAAKFHNGYGPVGFPISKYMLRMGYKDSFREINPDEVGRPEGTWAVIYGPYQFTRIDYVYYKGNGIRAVSSKIVKTAPEIDDVWASDHAAVLTTFELIN